MKFIFEQQKLASFAIQPPTSLRSKLWFWNAAFQKFWFKSYFCFSEFLTMKFIVWTSNFWRDGLAKWMILLRLRFWILELLFCLLRIFITYCLLIFRPAFWAAKNLTYSNGPFNCFFKGEIPNTLKHFRTESFCGWASDLVSQDGRMFRSRTL